MDCISKLSTICIWGVIILLLGCDENSNVDGTTDCEPGETRDCNCPDSTLGFQTCRKDSGTWGSCDCESVNTDTNNGSDGSDSTDGDTEVLCDNTRCSRYCTWAYCLWPDDVDGSLCERDCEAFCGNVLFDDEDTRLLDCQASVTNDFNCAESRACCETFFVNEICPET